MDRTTLHVIASVLLLAGLGLLVWGLGGSELVWQLGLGLVGAAMLFALATQWVGEEDRADGDDSSRGGEEERSGA